MIWLFFLHCCIDVQDITQDLVSRRQDLATTQEEADTVIIQQVARVTVGIVIVVVDDTDIYIPLLYFCHIGNRYCNVHMVSPVQGPAVLDINAAVEKHSQIIPDLLAAHGLTGCDTVATYYGIGKGIALKMLKSGKHNLNVLGNITEDVSFTSILEQTTHFMIAYYGQSNCLSFTEAPRQVWELKVGRSKANYKLVRQTFAHYRPQMRHSKRM